MVWSSVSNAPGHLQRMFSGISILYRIYNVYSQAYLFYVFFFPIFFLCLGTWVPERTSFHACRSETKIYKISRYTIRSVQSTSWNYFNWFLFGHCFSVLHQSPKEPGVISFWNYGIFCRWPTNGLKFLVLHNSFAS